MGGYAASGGYWISSTANKIFASETTITGSIGVFTIFPTFERSLGLPGRSFRWYWHHLAIRGDE